MKSLAKTYLNSKIFDKPFYVLYFVTRRCNIKCPMCSIFTHGDKKQELTLPEIKELAKNLKEIGAGMVILTGGEPFLREDLHEIVHIFSSRGILVRGQSNGILVTREKLKACYDGGMGFFTVSLDSADRNKFDTMCGHKGLWDSAVNAIRMSVEMQPHGYSTLANTVISSRNIDELPDIARFVDSLGAFIGFDPVHIQENSTIYSNDKSMLVSGEDRARIEHSFKELIKLKKSGCRIGNSLKFIETAMECMLAGDYRWRCDAGRLFFGISDSGEIMPCKHFNGLSTNRGSSLAEIFRSKTFKEKCNSQIDGCGGCCWSGGRETSMLFHDNSVIFERMKTYFKKVIL